MDSSTLTCDLLIYWYDTVLSFIIFVTILSIIVPPCETPTVNWINELSIQRFLGVLHYNEYTPQYYYAHIITVKVQWLFNKCRLHFISTLLFALF